MTNPTVIIMCHSVTARLAQEVLTAWPQKLQIRRPMLRVNFDLIDSQRPELSQYTPASSLPFRARSSFFSYANPLGVGPVSVCSGLPQGCCSKGTATDDTGRIKPCWSKDSSDMT